MKTKAVYVVVSDDADVYFEQAWVSAWSLKHHNPRMEVECVVDTETYDNVIKGYRYKALNVIDRLVKVEVPKEYNKKLRSRWLKTSLREHVTGDFLFIDTDTVICDEIGEVDDLEGDLLMVKNGHCNLSESYEEGEIRRHYKKIFGENLTNDEYYNSGVILCKDMPQVHTFYKKWHDDWKHSVSKGYSIDQQALLHTNSRLQLIREMDGIYNSQVRFSVLYLMKGKILHYFNNMLALNKACPFYDDSVYREVKLSKGLSPKLKELILHCKDAYLPMSYIVAGKELDIVYGESFRFLRYLYSKFPAYYHLIDLLCKIQYRIFLRIKR